MPVSHNMSLSNTRKACRYHVTCHLAKAWRYHLTSGHLATRARHADITQHATYQHAQGMTVSFSIRSLGNTRKACRYHVTCHLATRARHAGITQHFVIWQHVQGMTVSRNISSPGNTCKACRYHATFRHLATRARHAGIT